MPVDEDRGFSPGEPASAGQSESPRFAGASPIRWVLAASVGVALVLLAIRVGEYHREGLVPGVVLDDSYISFRYARNLVRGHGLVYNVGERVEGYTNFLWTVAVAGAMAAGARPEPAAEVLAALAAAGTVLLLGGLSRKLLRGPLSAPARFLPPVAFAAIGSQARHAVSGMETLLFVFFIVAGFACLVRDRRRAAGYAEPGRAARGVSDRSALLAGALFGLAALTRPEGALYAAIGALWALWDGPLATAPGSRLRGRLRPAVLLALAFLAFVGPHLAWRWSYYGYPLPNTYYAKVGAALSERLVAGWANLAKALSRWSIQPVLVLALLAVAAVRKDRFWLWAYGVAAATGAYFVLMGGDFLAFFGPRLLMPALPFVLLLAAEGLRGTAAAVPALARRRGVGPVLVGAIVLGVCLHALAFAWPPRAADLRGLATLHHTWRLTGEWLARHAPPDALIATSAAGIIPYLADRPTLDMFGLADEHIAHRADVDPAMPPGHEKSDPFYVLERRPDFLHVVNLSPEGNPRTARLGLVAGRIAEEYEIVAQVKLFGGRRVQGRWIIETRRFRPGLHRRGYRSAIFRRIDDPSEVRALAAHDSLVR